ncbi:MAG TPA: AarF/UbiB family protein [Chitinophagales bacterium]|nr:AarF/UbiB family protein [Chitinophagales bacterium]
MFKIFRLPMYYPRALRAVHILYILLKFLVVNWLSSTTLTFWLVPKRFKREGTVITLPERLRMVIEELGPTFIKFGQILADRPDVVSDKLREELKKLQNKAVPFEDDKAVLLIEAELGGPLKNVFEKFNPKAIAAASIGQVYEGTLLNGEKVIIKIQRPNIEGKIKLDLHILEYFAQQLVKEFPGLHVVDIIGVVEEFGITLLHELNYLNEASNAMRFSDMFKNVPYCKIPRVYLQLSTSRMLIMEDVTGIAPDNPERLIAHGLDPQIIAENGSRIFLEMMYKHGFFHADPHAGNIFILPGNVVALIDFGMVGTLKPAHMQFLAGFTLGLANRDAETLTDALLVMCEKKFYDEKQNLQFSVHEMLLRYTSLSYEKINFSLVLNECVKIILNYKLRLPGSIYLLLKALATIEKFGYVLDPQISLPAIVRPYAESLIREKFSAKKFAHEAYDMLKDYGAFFRDFPSEVNELLYKLKQGKIVVDIQVSDKDLFTKSIRQLAGTVGLTLLLGGMLTASVIMNVWGKSTTSTDFMFGISLFFSVWLMLRLFFRTR